TGATVHYVTVHITTDGADLLPEVGTLTWSGGDLSSRTVYVKVLKDGTQEADERFALETLCPASGVDGGASAEGVVLNDDGGLPLPPLPVVHTYHCRQ
ncbi:MAG TPA: hypothetical protein VF062_01720, partial [Candidatus Limnocylindrales bacterium]